MSGYSVREATAWLAGQGIAGFVQKPFDQAMLVAAVRQAVVR
jgi:FixJ family two-component response regulator